MLQNPQPSFYIAISGMNHPKIRAAVDRFTADSYEVPFSRLERAITHRPALCSLHETGWGESGASHPHAMGSRDAGHSAATRHGAEALLPGRPALGPCADDCSTSSTLIS